MKKNLLCIALILALGINPCVQNVNGQVSKIVRYGVMGGYGLWRTGEAMKCERARMDAEMRSKYNTTTRIYPNGYTNLQLRSTKDSKAETDITPAEPKTVKTTKKYPNGGVYKGEMKDGKREGNGVMTFANGDRYEGYWVDDMMNGHGTYTWRSGDRYDGQFRDNQKHFSGKYYYKNGMTYEGSYYNGKKNGYGVLYDNGKVVRSGEWKDGLFIGL